MAELGDWFHNLDLGGVKTAPNTFSATTRRCKWQAFAHAVPARLDGKTVLDVGCNAGFYSLEMKRRGAARVLAIDDDEALPGAGALRGGGVGLDVEFERLERVRRRPASGSLRSGHLHGRALSPALPAARARPVCASTWSHDALLFQSMLRGALHDPARSREDYPFDETGPVRRPELPEAALRGAPLRRRSDELVDAQQGLRRSHAAQQPASSSSEHPELEVYLCRGRAIGRAGWRCRVGTERGPARERRSRDALERAEQPVALGLRARPGLEPVRRDGAKLAARRRARGEPEAPDRARRHLADRRRASSATGAARACSTRSTPSRCTAFRSTGTTGRSTSGPRSWRRSARSRPSRSG